MTITNISSESEVPLSGGNSNDGIVRIGDTVRRTMKPERHSVHRVLSFLHSRGFESCPQFLGIDEQGRETLTYIDGDCSINPDFWQSERYLISAAKLLGPIMMRSRHFKLKKMISGSLNTLIKADMR